MEDVLGYEVLGNTALRWLLATATLLGTIALLFVVKRAVVRRLSRMSERTTTLYDDVLVKVLDRTSPVTIAGAGLAAGARVLDLPGETDLWVGRALVVVLCVQLGRWLTDSVQRVLDTKQDPDRPPGQKTAGAAASFVTNLVVWTVVILVVLSNFGVEVSTLIAGLGIGGVAAALAVQNVLGDLFSAFSIYVDRPFDLADFVVVGDYAGNVEKIGWRSTQLRSISGEMIVLANSDLAQSRIRNFKRMQERRVVVQFGVEYGTPAAKVEAMPKMIREVVEAVEGVRFDRAHFKGYGDSSLDFETVFYVLAPDYTIFMDRQQAFLLGIYRRFEEEGLSFAFPTRTMHLVREAGADESPGVDQPRLR